MELFPILSQGLLKDQLEITYKGEVLPEPTLLAVNIRNTGNVAIDNPPIEIEAIGTTYVIPGYIEDVPPGYENLWTLERSDAESCKIKLDHINPGQIVKARFFLDEIPDKKLLFKCPMRDLTIKEVDPKAKEKLLESIQEIGLPLPLHLAISLSRRLRKLL